MTPMNKKTLARPLLFILIVSFASLHLPCASFAATSTQNETPAETQKAALISSLQTKLAKYLASTKASGLESDPAISDGESANRAADALTDYFVAHPMDRTDALILARINSDLSTVEVDGYSAEFAYRTKKQAIWKDVLKECPVQPTSKALADQTTLSKDGFSPVTEEDICLLKKMLRAMSRAEKNGNG